MVLRANAVLPCETCGSTLTPWGAVSHGDGAISDEYGCDSCEEPRLEIHATYCTCEDCNSGVSRAHYIY